MTADPRLTHRAFVDVITHVSEIVCLEPGWTQPVPFHPVASRSRRHCTAPHATRMRSPQHRGVWLVAP